MKTSKENIKAGAAVAIGVVALLAFLYGTGAALAYFFGTGAAVAVGAVALSALFFGRDAAVATGAVALLAYFFGRGAAVAILLAFFFGAGLIYFCKKMKASKEAENENIKAGGAAVAAAGAVGAMALLAYGVYALRSGSDPDSDSGSSRKTMKAPGKGYRIFRDDFERNPASYFRDLHKKM